MTNRKKNNITLYCDVDGVLNPLKRRSGTTSKRIWRTVPLINVKLPVWFTWKKEIPEFFNTLSGAKKYILSTWNEQGRTVLEETMGLKSFEHIPYRMPFKDIGNQSTKYELLKQHQKQNPSPFVWIDDVATKNFKEEEWEGYYPHLIIRPNAYVGVTVEDLIKVKKFIATVRE